MLFEVDSESFVAAARIYATKAEQLLDTIAAIGRESWRTKILVNAASLVGSARALTTILPHESPSVVDWIGELESRIRELLEPEPSPA